MAEAGGSEVEGQPWLLVDPDSKEIMLNKQQSILKAGFCFSA
jgi:hypothetical protein